MRLKKYFSFNGRNLQPAEFNTKDTGCKIALAIGYRVYRPVPATQPCTLASTTGYRVYRLHSLVHLLQQLVTVYRPLLATLPCTLASTTGCRVYRPVPATQPCTLASRNWLQSVPAGTGYTALYTLAIGYIWIQPTGYKSTDRVLPTQSLLYSASPNWLHKLAKYRPVAV